MDCVLREGARVWLRDGDQMLPCTVGPSRAGTVELTSDYGQAFCLPQAALSHDKVSPMHSSSIEGVEDMSALADLHEGAIMHNLHLRFHDNKIYTYIGSILAAVNPYRLIDGLYDKAAVGRYAQNLLGELPPHIYAIANECYRCLWKRLDSQCVLISGESGAGKTESTKLILNFLSETSQGAGKAAQSGPTNTNVETAILESSPIMEAFGNAKTVYNNNSSRFGKFIQLHFSQQGFIQGGRILDYLLEKNRVVRQNPGERNFHVFYALLAGTTAEQKESLCLSEPNSYKYLAQSGCISDDACDDVKSFEKVMTAMQVMAFVKEEVREVLKLLSGVLQLGNIEFVTAGGAQISNKDVVSVVSELLGLDSLQLSEVLTQRSMILRGEEISTPLTIEQAEDSRNSMAMALYSQCFSWIIQKINGRIKGNDNFKSIGILDIFGFENFEVNRFEQFNINYANEKLQEYFNKHIFSLEQLEYNREGIIWEDINWMDNGECLDLIEKKLGMLALINEESRFPKGTDFTMLEKLHGQHATNQFYTKPRVADHQFGIKHYAGEVLYDVRGFLEKNRDTFRDDLLNVLRESGIDFIYDLFERVSGGGGEETLKAGAKQRRPTVSSQFKDSLHSLMASLSTSNPFFVRCIKPNMKKLAQRFEHVVVLNQLRYSGMLETVRIRRAGYPVRRPFQDFYSRYKVLLGNREVPDDPKGKCIALLRVYDAKNAAWQLGRTKVFLRDTLEQNLEKLRDTELHKSATLIRAHVLAYLARKRFRRLRACAVAVQAWFRCRSCQRRFSRLRASAITLQKHRRSALARRLYRALLEEKRRREEEERRRREEELRRMEEEQRKLEAELAQKQEEEEMRKKATMAAAAGATDGENPTTAGSDPMQETEQLLVIQRLEREIDELRQLQLAAVDAAAPAKDPLARPSPTELGSEAEGEWLAREQAIRRLEQEAACAAQDFLESLDFGEGYDSEGGALSRSSGGSLEGPPRPESRGKAPEEEDDEGFVGGGAEEHHRGSSRPGSRGTGAGGAVGELGEGGDGTSGEGVVGSKGSYDQRTSGIHTSDESFEEDQLAGRTAPDAAVAEAQEEPVYDAPLLEEFDLEGEDTASVTGTETVRMRRTSRQPLSPEREFRYSVNTYNGSAYPYGSLDGPQLSVGESDEDFDRGFDEEDLASRRETIYSSLGTPYFHSYLHIKVGMMNMWKRRWCVLKDDTFMWFRAKQEALKAGWLHKKGGGTSTLSRRNWKRRWFVLRDAKLMYFESDSEEKLKGVLDVRSAREIIDNTDKENGINVVMKERTYHLIAESPEDASEWFSAMSRVHGASEQELQTMHDEMANPKNAVGTLDVGLIDAACASDNPDRQNSFVIITANRVLQCNTDTAEEMHHWIALLQRSKGDARVEGQEFIVRGWLHKEVKGSSKGTVRSALTQRLKKRWVVLTHNSLDYYRSSERGTTKLGTLVLNSLCCITQADERTFKETGYWSITVHGRKHSYHLYTKLLSEASRWASAVQTVIDSKTPIETPTQQLIQDIKENMCSAEVVDQIYKRNPILRYSQHPLRSPLLPLPYGDVSPNLPKERGYTTLQEEAVRVFHTLQGLDAVPEPLPIYQGVLQTCHDLRPLHDELYCQLVKQTSFAPQPLGTGGLRTWHLFACLSCTFPPGRAVLRYVRFHLKRVKDRFPGTETEQYASFILDSLKKTKLREFIPSQEEIQAIVSRQEMTTTIYCHGGGSCKITIDSHTTAGEVVAKLMRGLAMEGSRNTFSLFERRGKMEKALENRTIVVDVLAKFEKMGAENETEEVMMDDGSSSNSWRLYFKLYCFLDTGHVPSDSVEFAFMFEQAHEGLVRGHFPAPEETLQQLAALRLQYILGDNSNQASFPQPPGLDSVYPVGRLRSRITAATKTPAGMGASPLATGASSPGSPASPSSGAGERRLTGFLEGTLRRTLRRQKAPSFEVEADKERDGSGSGSPGSGGASHATPGAGGGQDQLLELWVKEEIQAARAGILDKWQQLRGLGQEQAMARYMAIVQEWAGYGSTLFDVESKEGGFPKELWLAVGKDGVAVHKRGEPRPLESFTYEQILSFGAPQSSSYRIVLEGREMLFETIQVLEVAKLMKAYINSIVHKRYSRHSLSSRSSTGPIVRTR
ncbi:unconventional myosin-X-like [Petromyzon marinus]|uniref:unconventional myosin-X-like n=1 Tax=Petromyzon marinus TaxID=7757 RepID=UPI003F7297D4